MAIPEHDERTAARRALDEQIAGEPMLPPPDLTPDVKPVPVEAHLSKPRRRPLAVAGIVENGLIRPIDSEIKLPEHARVIIVAAGND